MTGAIKDDVTRHRKLNLFAVDPTSRCRRGGLRKSHLVPELVLVLDFLFLIALTASSSSALLRAPGFRRHVGLDYFRRLRFRHTLPTHDVESRTAVEPHH